MSRIKFKLMRNHNSVAFTITDMDERGRNTGDEFTASNGMKVSSRRCPALIPDEVFVRGSCRDEDTMIATYTFCTEKEATTYINRLYEALKEWAENAPCFKKCIEEHVSDNDGCIEFELP